MTYFRKRLGGEVIQEVNDGSRLKKHGNRRTSTIRMTTVRGVERHRSTQAHPVLNRRKRTWHQGKLLLDATCAPADIAYPTDLSLLNEAREKLEAIIDVLHAPHRGSFPKPRTYRQNARKAYLVNSN